MASNPVPRTFSIVIIMKPKDGRSLAAELILMEGMKLKKASREVICDRFFRKTIKKESEGDSLGISCNFLEKRVGHLNEKEFRCIASIVYGISLTGAT